MVDWEFAERVVALVRKITYKEGYALDAKIDAKDSQGRMFLQVKCWRPDSGTGEMGWGRGGKAYLSEHMIDSEIVRIAFGLFKAYEEHECREFFKLSDRAVFGPHIDIEALWSVANTLDYRA